MYIIGIANIIIKNIIDITNKVLSPDNLLLTRNMAANDAGTNPTKLLQK